MNIKAVSFIFLLSFLFQFLFASSQNPINSGVKKGSKSILEELNSPKLGQGNVMVYEDEAIAGILTRPATNSKIYTSEDGVSQYLEMKGYKIQVFSGNNQRKSKDEAYSKQNLINEAFSDIETVVFFKSPRWILRAGNFKTREEATIVLEQIKEQFPDFGKEMYIVSDIVKIPY